MSKKSAVSKKSTKKSIRKAASKKGSVVPMAYKTKYKATGKNSCGDTLSEKLAKVCQTKEGKVDLKKIAAVKKENGIEDSRWLNLNPGMQRMNLGNVLRGILRSDGKIKLAGKVVKK